MHCTYVYVCIYDDVHMHVCMYILNMPEIISGENTVLRILCCQRTKSNVVHTNLTEGVISKLDVPCTGQHVVDVWQLLHNTVDDIL